MNNAKGKPRALPEIQLDYSDPFIKSLSKRIIFLDIETSLIDVRVYRPGQQYISAEQIRSKTKILTIAYGSFYDLEHKGEKAVKVLSNRKSKAFKKNPKVGCLDDTEVLHQIWSVLDKAEVIVAHNAKFDRGWILGRFVEMGLTLPSRFFTFCTYENLKPYNMTSKKLGQLSKTLIGTEKVDTHMRLWNDCSDGKASAFKEMEEYNKGDVYNTLFKLYKRTAYYNPKMAIDFTNPASDEIQCKVDGGPLFETGKYRKHLNGCVYTKYINPRSKQEYRDRYVENAKKAGLGYIVPLM